MPSNPRHSASFAELLSGIRGVQNNKEYLSRDFRFADILTKMAVCSPLPFTTIYTGLQEMRLCVQLRSGRKFVKFEDNWHCMPKNFWGLLVDVHENGKAAVLFLKLNDWFDVCSAFSVARCGNTGKSLLWPLSPAACPKTQTKDPRKSAQRATSSNVQQYCPLFSKRHHLYRALMFLHSKRLCLRLQRLILHH